MLAEEVDAKYLIHSRMEIIALLRSVSHEHAMVTAHLDSGTESMLTTILVVLQDKDAIILDYGVNEHINKRLLENNKTVFVTTSNKVKVQFSADAVTRVKYDGDYAFKVAIPDMVLRLQKREYYRVDTPIIHPLRCMIPHPPEAGEGQHPDADEPSEEDVLIASVIHDLTNISAREPLIAILSNISIGGVGIINFPDDVHIEPGIIFRECRITIPDIGELCIDLEVVNTSDIETRRGESHLQYGCRFIDIKGGMQSRIQRYIINLERERKKKLSGG